MHEQRGRDERHAGVSLDMAHLVLRIAIVILAVLPFINLEGNHMFFSLAFLSAALLSTASGIFECKTWGRDKKKFCLGALQLVLAMGPGILGVLNAISIWIQR